MRSYRRRALVWLLPGVVVLALAHPSPAVSAPGSSSPGTMALANQSKTGQEGSWLGGLNSQVSLVVEGRPAGGTAWPQGWSMDTYGQDLPPVAATLDPTAPQPTAQQVSGAAAGFTPETTGPGFGCQVVDLLTGQVIYQSDAAAPRTPASTLKILTAAAAVATLGADATLTTSAVMERQTADLATVTLVAGGDVLLGPGESQAGEVVGRAGLGDLASQVAVELRARGVHQVKLTLDDTLFTGPNLIADWGWWSGAAWGGPVMPLAVNAGRDGPSFDQVNYSPDAAMAAAQQFGQLLATAGQDQGLALPTFDLAGSPTRAAASPEATLVGQIDSAPVGQLAGYMLAHSDNMLAEALGRAVARAQGLPVSFAGAGQGILQAITNLGVDTTGVSLADASGLSPASKIPPATLTELLVKVAGPEAGELGAVSRGLAVGGLDGTLIHRLSEVPSAGNVRAKTGTLTGVTSLAGLVQTDGGRQLIFAAMADQTQEVGYDTARSAIDQFVHNLATLPAP